MKAWVLIPQFTINMEEETIKGNVRNDKYEYTKREQK